MQNSTKISSSQTLFFKKIFPKIWFGFIGFFLVVSILSGGVLLVTGESLSAKSLLFIIIPITMGIIGHTTFKKLFYDLADHVEDCGDYLLVKNNRNEENIDLKNITNVNFNLMQPPQITLLLDKPSKFGNEIKFIPKTKISWLPLPDDTMAKELIRRSQNARSSA